MADLESMVSDILAASPSAPRPLSVREQVLGPARSLVNGAALGWGNELEALIGENFGKGSYDDILNNINAERARYEQAVPGVTTGLEVAGSFALPVGKIGSLFKGAPAGLSLLSKAPVQLVTTGAIQGAGYAEPGERLKGAAVGAGTSATIGTIMNALGRVFSDPARQAERLRTSAYGVPQPSIKNAINKVDDLALEEVPLIKTIKKFEKEGVISATNDTSDNVINLVSKEKKAVSDLLPILKEVDEVVPPQRAVFPPEDPILPFFPKRAISFVESKTGTAGEDAAKALEDELVTLVKRDIKTGSIAELQKAKVGLNYKFDNKASAYKPDLIRALRSDIREEIERRVDSAARNGLISSDKVGRVRELNQQFGEARELKDIFRQNLYKEYGGDIIEDASNLQKTTNGAGTAIQASANTGHPLWAMLGLAGQALRMPEIKGEIAGGFEQFAPLLSGASSLFRGLPNRTTTAAILSQQEPKMKPPMQNASDLSGLLESILAAQPSKKKMNSTENKIDVERLVKAMVRQESGGDPNAIGYETPETKRLGERAIGLMQIMPSTAKDIAKELGVKEYDLTDPDTNLRFGTHYVQGLLDKFGGDPELALTAYHSGPNRVAGLLKEAKGSKLSDIIDQLGPAGREYASRILGFYNA